MNVLRKIGVQKVQASSLMETITASVVFMIVFVMSIDTLTRLLTYDTDNGDYLLIENEMKRCRKQICAKELAPGEQTFLYEWGEINAEIALYKENIYQIDISATNKKKFRQIGYRFLQANP